MPARRETARLDDVTPQPTVAVATPQEAVGDVTPTPRAGFRSPGLRFASSTWRAAPVPHRPGQPGCSGLVLLYS